jgi:integrase
MARMIPANERLKHRYLDYLKQAKGRDEKTLDKVAAALNEFEAAIGWKDFKRFSRHWGEVFKTHLERARNKRTGRPLSVSTVDAMLAYVKAFILWLADQPGYKSRVGYADAEYFNNSKKAARAAHTQRPIPYPSLDQCLYAFKAMPEDDKFQKRDKALFAFFMLTGARVGAAATLMLKHVNLFDGHIFQDAREVATKNAKTIDTWFFPVDCAYREFFEEWVGICERSSSSQIRTRCFRRRRSRSETASSRKRGLHARGIRVAASSTPLSGRPSRECICPSSRHMRSARRWRCTAIRSAGRARSSKHSA